MSITENLKNMTSTLQEGAKNATASVSHVALRLVSGFFVALVLSLIIQEIMQSGVLMLVFFMTVFMSATYVFLRRFSILQILVFDLIYILILSLMRLYIMVAP